MKPCMTITDRFRRLLPPVLMATAVACSDGIAPGDDSAPVPGPRTALNHLRWEAPMSPDRFSAVLGTPTGETALARNKYIAAFEGGDGTADGLYQVSFWARKGEYRYLTIVATTTNTDGSQHLDAFLFFGVPEQALASRPDGSPIAAGDSVLITATLNSTELLVHLEPSGLQFNPAAPAPLYLWYGGAGDDLNGDGTVDAADADIEQNQLGVWVQEGASPWEQMVSEQSLADKWFLAWLEHFSGYTVSW